MMLAFIIPLVVGLFGSSTAVTATTAATAGHIFGSEAVEGDSQQHLLRGRGQDVGADFDKDDQDDDMLVSLMTSPSPTSSPTATPPPTYQASTVGCTSFQSIEGTSGATVVPLVGYNNGNDGFADVTFPDENSFNLFGTTPLTTIRIFADGCIGIAPSNTATYIFSTPGQAIAVGMVAGGNQETIPRICAAHEDLDPVSDPSVSILGKPDSFVISWETSSDLTDIVEAQLELYYSTGNFEIRWGIINTDDNVFFNNNNIAAGIDYDMEPFPRATPAVGNKFDAFGVTIGGDTAGMPTGKCNLFTVVGPP